MLSVKQAEDGTFNILGVTATMLLMLEEVLVTAPSSGMEIRRKRVDFLVAIKPATEKAVRQAARNAMEREQKRRAESGKGKSKSIGARLAERMAARDDDDDDDGRDLVDIDDEIKANDDEWLASMADDDDDDDSASDDDGE